MTIQLRYKINEELHADVVLGKDKSLPRGIAIKMLAQSKVPDFASLLHKVLQNDAEEPRLRRLAAIGIWRANAVETQSYLLKAAETVKDPVVLIAVVKCLGRIGDQRALETILALMRSGQGVLAAQASFAASLISYRLGLEGNDLQLLTQYVKMPTAPQQRLNFAVPTKAESDMFISCLAHEPFGIELSKDSLLQFNCSAGTWIIGFNRNIVGHNATDILQRRKTFLGILAAKHSEDGRYSASYLILTTPHSRKGKADILINRITGEPAWAGTITSIASSQAKFTIQTVGRIGIVPIELEGFVAANGEISVTKALTATKISEKRYPGPFPIN